MTQNEWRQVIDEAIGRYERSTDRVRGAPGNKAWKRCLGFSAALGAAAVMAPNLEGAIQYSGPQNIHIVGPNGLAPLNLDGDGVFGNDFRASMLTNPSWGGATVIAYNGNRMMGNTNGGWALRLPGGAAVGGGGPWLGTASAGLREGAFGQFGQWPGDTMGSIGQAGFAGVRFAGAGGTHYGWIRIGIDNNPGGRPVALTVYDWAWNDVAGDPINAGEGSVPEPGTAAMGLTMLALGAVGVLRNRKKRADAQTAV